MPAAAVCPPAPDAVLGEVSAEMTAVLANMVESALAGGLLPVCEPEEEVSGDDAWGAESDRGAPETDRDRLHSTVNAGAGPRAHRVHRPPVRTGRRSRQAGLASGRYRGHRRRPGA